MGRWSQIRHDTGNCGLSVTRVTPRRGGFWLGCTDKARSWATVMDLFSRARGLLAGRMPLPAAEPLRKLGKSYHAVTIEPGPRCCTLARSISDKRFLSTNAPPLPLKSCSRADCTCRYVHYADRRLGPRRAA